MSAPELDLIAGVTITVRGENGVVFDVDVPADGTVQRELLEDALDKGRLSVCDGGEPAEPEDHGVPGGSAKVVLGWVGDDVDRAREALAAEQAAEKPRKTLVAHLADMVAEAEDMAFIAAWADEAVASGDYTDRDEALAALSAYATGGEG